MAKFIGYHQQTINLLKQHYANVYNAKSFEEFKLAQLEYIAGLIKRAEVMQEQSEELAVLMTKQLNGRLEVGED